jgi:hypothetical protein
MRGFYTKQRNETYVHKESDAMAKVELSRPNF